MSMRRVIHAFLNDEKAKNSQYGWYLESELMREGDKQYCRLTYGTRSARQEIARKIVGHNAILANALGNPKWCGRPVASASYSYITNRLTEMAGESNISLYCGEAYLGLVGSDAHKKWRKLHRAKRELTPEQLKRREEKRAIRQLLRDNKKARTSSPVYAYDEAVGF